MAKSFLEFRFPSGLVVSGLFTDQQLDAIFPDGFKLNGPATQAKVTEQIAAALLREPSYRWSTIPTPAALEFHQRGET